MSLDNTAVVVFSRTNNTKSIAANIARHLHCPTFEIDSDLYPSGVIGYTRGIWRALRKKADPVRSDRWSIHKYDLLIVGTPIWAGNLTPPVRGFLKKHARQANHVAFFVTCGGSSALSVFEQMTKICGKLPLSMLELNATEIQSGHVEKKIEDFLTEIRMKLKRENRKIG